MNVTERLDVTKATKEKKKAAFNSKSVIPAARSHLQAELLRYQILEEHCCLPNS